MNKKIISILLLFVLVITSGFGCKLRSAAEVAAIKPFTITYWRAWDDKDAFKDIIAKYQAIHPNVNIEYRKFRYNEYESELLNALAEDRGPDIFSIPASMIGKYKTKIEPMPDKITMGYLMSKGTVKKETYVEMRTSPSLSLKDLKNNFVDVVYNDVVWSDINEQTKAVKNNVYGLPLYVDTMAMFYNKDLMNNAGISEVPLYWNKTFQQYVQKLTKLNTKNDLIQSGVALGGAKNIDRASDILALLMMQNGTPIMENGLVVFNKPAEVIGGVNYYPGIEAVRFYTDFANEAKEVYCWNELQDNSLKMFTTNRLALMFGYSYQIPIIKAEAPKLNFGIAKMPQIENSPRAINMANYWVETVSKKSKYKNEAWDFIQFAAKAANVKSYLDVTKRPTALRALVSTQADDIDIGVFASQVLTAKSWYKGKDSSAGEQVLEDLVSDARKATNVEMESVVSKAAMKLQQTIR